MPDFSSSKMVQSAARNEARIKGMLKEYRKAPDADPNHTIFTRRNADEAKKFNIFRYMFSKHSSTGRFGAKHRKDADDSISDLDFKGEMPQKAYFDPFSLKIIKPNRTTREDEPGTLVTSSYGMTNEEKLAMVEAKRIRGDFVSRVDTEIEESEKNDFEKSRIGHDAQMALAESIDVGQNFGEGVEPGKAQNEDSLIRTFNSGRKFKPDDGVIEDIPDSFKLELIVDEAPPKYSQEWGQFWAEQTKGFWAQVKGFFKNPFSREAPDEAAMKNELYEKFLLQIPEYRDTMNRNMAIARNFTPPQPYDPKTDPDLIDIRAGVHAATESKALGHAVVRLNARKFGVPLSKYSFLFGATTGAGMAGAITGGVSNPAYIKGGEKKGEYDIRYSDYLRAAARIRGVVGSMRSYSIIGYNCTSFAVDVAHAAGIPLKDEDSSAYIMTHRHRSQRVDSPYMLAMHLAEKEEREARENNTPLAKSRNSRIEAEVARRSAVVKKALNDTYRPVLLNVPILIDIARMKLFKEKDIGSFIDELIDSIVKKGEFVDRQNPVDGLSDDALQKAEDARTGGRKIIFGGAPSEQIFLAGLAADDEKLARLALRGIRKEDFFDDLFGQNLIQENIDRYKKMILLTNAYNDRYGRLDEAAADKYIYYIIGKIDEEQSIVRNQIRYIAQTTRSYKDIITQLKDLLNPFEPDVLGEGLFKFPTRIDAFISSRKISLPEPPVQQEKEEEPSETEDQAAEGESGEEAVAGSQADGSSEAKEQGSEEKSAEEGAAPAAEGAKVNSEAADKEKNAAPVEGAVPAKGIVPAVEAEAKTAAPVKESKPKAKTEAPKKSLIMEEELQPQHIKDLLVSFNEKEMLEAFIDSFKHSTVRIDGYNGTTGEDLKLADVLRVIAGLTDRDSVAKRIFVSYYSRIFNSSSESEGLDLFKDMLQRMAEDLSISDLTNTFAECDIV